MNCTLQELGWLSGIIDGEGTISIVKRASCFVPVVKMSNTSKILIDKYCEILDKLDISYHCYGKQKEGNRKYQWEVSIEGRPRVYKIITLLQDILIAKQNQAIKVTEWIESRGLDLRGKYTKNQLDIIDDIRLLNGRGKYFSENVI
jgi:hypothetical protein